ncbi:MAG: alpha/beta hydrolase [Actinomycetota bacterium]|nr:alpha/beta hydrolase [Actinomycetota bacterium]
MPLHPQAQVLVDLVNAMGGVPASDESLQQARDGLAMLHAGGSGEPEAVYAIGDLDADGVPIRVYRPSADDGLPVIVFLHGGGWTLGSVDVYDPVTRALANAAQATVVSVDYRLAPEHPFPAPLDDCMTALRWVAKNASAFEADGTRLAIAGDSAGGNLAATCALLARDAGEPELAFQALIYPVVDADFTTGSYQANGKGYLLEEPQMRWFFDCYTRGGTDPADWRVSPLRAPDVAGVAPALVITAEYDPLRDEGEAYARRLADAGVAVEARRYDGMIHAFFALMGTIDDGRAALEHTATAIRKAFGTL